MKNLLALISLLTLMSCPPQDDDLSPKNDAIEGSWQYSELFRNGVKVNVDFCDLQIFLFFNSNGNFMRETHSNENPDEACKLDSLKKGSWTNMENIYTVVTEDETNVYSVTFENNTFFYEQEVIENGTAFKYKYVYTQF